MGEGEDAATAEEEEDPSLTIHSSIPQSNPYPLDFMALFRQLKASAPPQVSLLIQFRHEGIWSDTFCVPCEVVTVDRCKVKHLWTHHKLRLKLKMCDPSTSFQVYLTDKILHLPPLPDILKVFYCHLRQAFCGSLSCASIVQVFFQMKKP